MELKNSKNGTNASIRIEKNSMALVKTQKSTFLKQIVAKELKCGVMWQNMLHELTLSIPTYLRRFSLSLKKPPYLSQ